MLTSRSVTIDGCQCDHVGATGLRVGIRGDLQTPGDEHISLELMCTIISLCYDDVDDLLEELWIFSNWNSVLMLLRNGLTPMKDHRNHACYILRGSFMDFSKLSHCIYVQTGHQVI